VKDGLNGCSKASALSAKLPFSLLAILYDPLRLQVGAEEIQIDLQGFDCEKHCSF